MGVCREHHYAAPLIYFLKINDEYMSTYYFYILCIIEEIYSFIRKVSLGEMWRNIQKEHKE